MRWERFYTRAPKEFVEEDQVIYEMIFHAFVV